MMNIISLIHSLFLWQYYLLFILSLFDKDLLVWWTTRICLICPQQWSRKLRFKVNYSFITSPKNCFCCNWKVLNSPEGTPAPEPAKPLKTVWKWVWKWEAITLSLLLILIIIGQLPPLSSLTRKTASTCSEDECEEAEADEGDGGLVRVGRILGTFCLECLRSWWWLIITDDDVKMAPIFVKYV